MHNTGSEDEISADDAISEDAEADDDLDEAGLDRPNKRAKAVRSLEDTSISDSEELLDREVSEDGTPLLSNCSVKPLIWFQSLKLCQRTTVPQSSRRTQNLWL